MTGIQLVNQWYNEGRLSPSLYELLIRRLTHPPFSPAALNIVGIEARQLETMILNGEIGRVHGVGAGRLAELRNLVKPHHLSLYVDVEQLTKYDQARKTVSVHHSGFAPET